MDINTLIPELKSLASKKTKANKIEKFVSIFLCPALLVVLVLFPSTEPFKSFYLENTAVYVLLAVVVYLMPNVLQTLYSKRINANIRDKVRPLSQEEVIQVQNMLLVEESEVLKL